MRVSTIVFDDKEETQLFEKADRNLQAISLFRDWPHMDRTEYLKSLSPANLIRLALGFEIRNQDGAREGTGPKQKKRSTIKKNRRR